MSELVQINNQGQITWATAVGRVADALSPLGHISRILAELNACVVDHRRMDLALKALQAKREIVNNEMKEQWLYRHRKLNDIWADHAGQMRETSILWRRLGIAYDNALMMSINQSESNEVRLLSQEVTVAMGSQMLTLHGQQGEMLIRLASVYQLGEISPDVSLWRALEA